MAKHQIGLEILTLTQIEQIIYYKHTLELSADVRSKVENCRNYLDKKLKNNEDPIYGINTGFGYLQNVKIDSGQLSQLQHNLLLSHACGTGEKVQAEIVRLMLLLKIQSLSYGHSAIALPTLQRLVDFYNNGILPVIYTQGSLGASGDLAPLAHMALPLIGEGDVRYLGEQISTAELYNRLNWKPLTLQSKEGLALINGTQFMTAYGMHCLLKVRRLSEWSDVTAAISIDAFNCRIEPFLELSHSLRPHRGQLKTASNIAEWLEGSELIQQPEKQTQDPYSFRCVPQVHGASKDTFQLCKIHIRNGNKFCNRQPQYLS